MKKIFRNIFDNLAACIVPTIPVLLGAGLLKIFIILVGPSGLKILSETNSTYIVFSFVTNSAYYFLPIFTAVSSGEHFKMDKYLAGLIGAMLIAPEFVELVNNGTKLNVFGLPIAATSYASQVLPPVIAIYVASIIYRFLNEKLSEQLRTLLTPTLTVALMVPIAFCAIGPVGVYVSDLLVKLVLLLKDLGPVGNGIMAALLPAVVILGLSGADITAMLILVSSGSDPILFFANVIFNSVLGFVVLARYVKHKDAKLLAMAITATIGGTSEPAVFGLGVNDITVLLSTSLGAFVGGFISRLFGVKTFSIASFGILGTVATLGEDSSFLGAIVAIIAGCTVGFIASILTERK